MRPLAVPLLLWALLSCATEPTVTPDAADPWTATLDALAQGRYDPGVALLLRERVQADDQDRRSRVYLGALTLLQARDAPLSQRAELLREGRGLLDAAGEDPELRAVRALALIRLPVWMGQRALAVRELESLRDHAALSPRLRSAVGRALE